MAVFSLHKIFAAAELFDFLTAILFFHMVTFLLRGRTLACFRHACLPFHAG
jgi:hypothetical protein